MSLKWIKYTIVSIALLFALSIIFLISVSYVYEEEIKQYAVDELNLHLDAKFNSEEIHLTVFEQFPYLALKFKNVLIEDETNSQQIDTLLFAEKLYLNLDLIDLILGKYEIRKISGEQVLMNLQVDSTGLDNYNIWKSDSTHKNKNIRFVLQEIEIDKLNLNYSNLVNQQQYRFYTEHLDFAGDFNNSIYDLSAKSNLVVTEFTSDHITYLTDKKAQIDLKIRVNSDSSSYLIKKGDVNIEGMAFDLKGNYQNKDTSFIDIGINGNEIMLQSLFNVFPLKMLEVLNAYKAKGMVQFNASIIGVFSKIKTPKIKAGFTIKNGSMIEQLSLTKLSSIDLKGNYTNKNNEGEQELNIESVNATLGGEKIKGKLHLKKFNSPEISGAVSGKISIKKMAEFSQISTLELGGYLNMDLLYKIHNNNDDYEIDLIKGAIDLFDLSAVTKDHKIAIEQTKGRFLFKGKSLNSNNIYGKINGSDYQMQMSFQNFMDFITGNNDRMIVKGKTSIKELDIDIYKNHQNSTASKFELPAFLTVDTDISIENLYYKSFRAKNLIGSITIEDSLIKADNVMFYASDGVYRLNSTLIADRNEEFKWNIEGKADNINVSKFFIGFENFGQDYLTDKHLKGIASFTFKVESFFDNSLSFYENKLNVQTQLKVNNGELIKHSSMYDIAAYLNNNKLVKSVVDTKTLSEKLEHIKFSELSNDIIIKEGVIHIPQMEIKSNVMNISLYGEHGFNDSIDYHISFRLRELLIKNDNNAEFGPIKDDELGKKLFLLMYGTVDNPLFKLDNEGKKQEKKDRVKEEKKELKTVLKDEFGLFSKDTTLTKKNNKKDTTIFQLEWEEDDVTPNDSVEAQKNTEKDTNNQKQTKLNKFLKKIGVEEEKENNVKFEIDQDN